MITVKSSNITIDPRAARFVYSDKTDSDNGIAHFFDDHGWLITFSDLTLLLLCFLLLWHGRSAVTMEPKITAAAVPVHVTVAQHQKNIDRLELKTAGEWHRLRDEIRKSLSEKELEGIVSIEAAEHELIITLKDAVPFASGDADLPEQALPVIKKIARIADERSQVLLEIIGHSDDRRIATSQFPSNWELSTARASRVARALIAAGVEPVRITAQGLAHFRPKVPNIDERSRGINRRVEIRLSSSPVSERDDRSH